MDAKDKIKNLTYFGNVTTKYCESRKGKNITFHDTIQGNKDFIFNFFESQPYYNEQMPIIIKSNRGTQFYKKIIKKGLEVQSDFFKKILRAIKHSNDDNSPKRYDKGKTIRYYKIPRLELLKMRKKNIDNYFLRKNKTVNWKKKPLKASNSMTEMTFKIHSPEGTVPKSTTNIINNNTIYNNANLSNTNYSNFNFLNSTISGDTFHTNSRKNESLRNFHNSKYSLNNNKINNFYLTRQTNISNKELGDNFNKTRKKLKYEKILKLENILNKCNEGLNYAQNIGNNMGRSSIDKSVEEVNKRLKIVLQNGDQRVIEDKGKGNKKYKKLEKEKFKELKRKMDIKMSNNYAYVNRKELNNVMNDNDTIFAYQIYLKEMNNINRRLVKKKEIEKRNISLVKDLLENTFRQKEFLKYKIDNYYERNAKKDELKIFSFKNKDDFFINKNEKDHLKGNLLPKLFDLKDYCYGREKYNPIAGIQNV